MAKTKKRATNNAEDTAKDTVKTGDLSIRMYCIGTGDCFILKFGLSPGKTFTMMIDCGCCVGDKKWFEPYVRDLENHVNKHIDLLVVTHEHMDHVNGFAKWEEVFKADDFKIEEAWFAWTEKPGDPTGEAAELMKKRSTMKLALSNAIKAIDQRRPGLEKDLKQSAFETELLAAQKAFSDGLNSLGSVNLGEEGENGNTLAGMQKIKDILKAKKTRTRYLGPGETITVSALPGVKFHILGPPRSREFIFKDGREGSDVFKRNMVLNESTLAARAFNASEDLFDPDDLPFQPEYMATPEEKDKLLEGYRAQDWRNIDDEWLLSAGSLAIRLNTHINNTSLAFAIESEHSQKVALMPGDAEFGSWESWHLIEKWKERGKDKTTWAQDLLGRTVFYKVSHHLSYNGTALEKGVKMMTDENLAAMATLDRNRISSGWKSTMPNNLLVEELTKKTNGRFFIMDELGVTNPPSGALNMETLRPANYRKVDRKDAKATLYKQYTFPFLK